MIVRTRFSVSYGSVLLSSGDGDGAFVLVVHLLRACRLSVVDGGDIRSLVVAVAVVVVDVVGVVDVLLMRVLYSVGHLFK